MSILWEGYRLVTSTPMYKAHCILKVDFVFVKRTHSNFWPVVFWGFFNVGGEDGFETIGLGISLKGKIRGWN